MAEAAAERVGEIGLGDIDHLLLGAQMMSSGGTVPGTVAASWLERTLAVSGPVRLASVSDLPPDALCVPVGNLGSPTVLEEKLPAGDEYVYAIRGIEHRLGARVDAIAAFDAASINALTPVLAAAQLGLPLVDADGMGRTFPRIEITVWSAAGILAAPMVLVNSHGEAVTIACADNRRIEPLARPAVSALGGWCAAALYPMTAGTLARHGVHGSISRALLLGRALADARERGSPHDADLAGELGARLLFTGSVVEVSRQTGGGGARGFVIVTDRTGNGRMLRIEMQNECLLALVDGRVAAAVPDVISPIEQGGCQPVGVEQLHYGQMLDVLCFAADPAWHTPEGLAMAGPAAFGYPLPSGGRR